jgi:uncharacterized protein
MLTERIFRVLDRHPEILEAYLFGSQARGDATARSDIDVAIYVDRSQIVPAPYGLGAEIASELMAELGRNDVDLVILNDAPPLLYHRVLADGVRILSRDLARTTTREGQAVSRYLDFLPHLERMADLEGARIAEGRFGR